MFFSELSSSSCSYEASGNGRPGRPQPVGTYVSIWPTGDHYRRTTNAETLKRRETDLWGLVKGAGNKGPVRRFRRYGLLYPSQPRTICPWRGMSSSKKLFIHTELRETARRGRVSSLPIGIWSSTSLLRLPHKETARDSHRPCFRRTIPDTYVDRCRLLCAPALHPCF